MTKLGHGVVLLIDLEFSRIIANLRCQLSLAGHDTAKPSLRHSQPSNIAAHALPSRSVRRRTECCAHIIGKMLQFARGGNSAGNCGMRDHEFQKELRPACAADLIRPGRERFAADSAE